MHISRDRYTRIDRDVDKYTYTNRTNNKHKQDSLNYARQRRRRHSIDARYVKSRQH